MLSTNYDSRLFITEEENVYSFGHNEDITQHVLGYIKDPKILFNLSQVNKLIRNTISIEMVITACMMSGGRTLQSMINLQPSIRRKIIRVPSALRLLYVCNLNRCEFCGNKQIKTGHVKRNAKPRYIREAWGCVFPCWTCLTKIRDSSISQNWRYPCLTRAWHRQPLPNGKKLYDREPEMNYENNQQIYNHIFSHPQVASYVYGDQINDGANGWEILWSFPMKDKFGEYISPLITYEDIDPLVRYLKTPHNLGVSHYLKHNIPVTSSTTEYETFINTFNVMVAKGCITQQRQKNERLQQINFHRRVNKIERAVQSIALIIRYVNRQYLEPLRRNFISRTSYEDVVLLVQRLLLCYSEVHQVHRKHCIEYNTGNYDVDRQLMDLLEPVILKPNITKSEAQKYAIKVFKSWIETMWAQGFVCALYEENTVNLRNDFQLNRWPTIRRQASSRHHLGRRWRDTHERRT